MGCKCTGCRGGLGATAIEYGPMTGMRNASRSTGSHVSGNPFGGGVRGAITKSMTKGARSLGSLGDDDPSASIDPVVEAANAPHIVDTSSIQTQYETCLRGGGSFASCNQIPGVTPEMIAAAKLKQVFSAPASALAAITSDPTKMAVAGGVLVGLYLMFRKKKR